MPERGLRPPALEVGGALEVVGHRAPYRVTEVVAPSMSSRSLVVSSASAVAMFFSRRCTFVALSEQPNRQKTQKLRLAPGSCRARR